jgi:hypothetical protein
MKLVIIKIFSASSNFIPLDADTTPPPSTPFSNTLSVCPLNVGDQVSHPRRTTGKITVDTSRIYPQHVSLLVKYPLKIQWGNFDNSYL